MYTGSELRLERVHAVLIASLEREYGPNHVMVHRARRITEELQEAKWEELARKMALLEWDTV